MYKMIKGYELTHEIIPKTHTLKKIPLLIIRKMQSKTVSQ